MMRFRTIQEEDKAFETFRRDGTSVLTFILFQSFISLCSLYCIYLKTISSTSIPLAWMVILYMIPNFTGWALILLKFSSGDYISCTYTLFGQLLRYVSWLENLSLLSFMMAAGTTVCNGVIMARKDGTHYQNSFAQVDAETAHGLLPQDTTLLFMILPVAYSVVVKGISLRITRLSWLASAITTSITIFVSDCYASIPFVIILATFSAIIITELECQSRQHFYCSEKTKLAAMENTAARSRMENASSTEMRHMIGNVAHDLKTPLTAFLSGLDFITSVINDMQDKITQNALTASHVYHCLEGIRSIVQNAHNINSFMTMAINRCIDYTKANNGLQLTARYETVNLVECIQLPLNCMKDLQSTAEIPIEFSGVNPSICTHIITDKQWLQENLLCLLSNAVKYSKKKSGKIQISCYMILKAENSNDFIMTSGVNRPHFARTRSCSTTSHTIFDQLQNSNHHMIMEREERDPQIVMEDSSMSSYNSIDRFRILPSKPQSFDASRNLSPYFWFNGWLRTKSPFSYFSSGISTKSINCYHSNSSSSNWNSFNDLYVSKDENDPSLVNETTPLTTPHHLTITDFKNTPSPPPSARTRQLRMDHEGDMETFTESSIAPFLRFEVMDCGIGMTDVVMDALFRPFTQAQRLAGGTGLGLFSLARRIEALRGYYGVEKRPDNKQGSLFWFEIPYKPDEATATLYRSIQSFSSTSDSYSEKELREDADREGDGEGDLMVLDQRQLHDFLLPHELPLLGIPKGIAVRMKSTGKSNPMKSIESSETISSQLSRGSSGGSLHQWKSIQNMNILLVDDSISILKMTAMLLRKQGHHVTIAENGAEALDLVLESRRGMMNKGGDDLSQVPNGDGKSSLDEKKDMSEGEGHPFDIILMDLQMPIMDGLESIQRIRKLFENDTIDQQNYESHDRSQGGGLGIAVSHTSSSSYRRPYILGLSANSDHITIQQAFNAGADMFMPKPFTLQTFNENCAKIFSTSLMKL